MNELVELPPEIALLKSLKALRVRFHVPTYFLSGTHDCVDQ